MGKILPGGPGRPPIFDPNQRYDKTYTGEQYVGNERIDQGFYDSDEFKNFSFTQKIGGMDTQQITQSKYGFGQASGSQAGRAFRAIDSAYESYLNRVGATDEGIDSNYYGSDAYQNRTRPKPIERPERPPDAPTRPTRGKFRRPVVKPPQTEQEKVEKQQRKAQEIQAQEIEAAISQQPQKRGKKMSIASGSPLGGSGSLL